MTTVAEALALLQRSKAAAASSLRQAKAAALAQLSQSQHRLSPRHTPSGPRRRHEGIEDEDQGIVAAEASANGATVTVSLLAAGFVVGPGGASVRAICGATGADIRSYTESQGGRRVRAFVIEGKHKHVAHALQLIAAAVEKYCALTGGAYCNLQVEREQVIGGVTFIYSPPPRAAVPYAAALKALHESPCVPTKPPVLFSPRTAGKENSSGGSAAAAALLLAAGSGQDHHPLGLLTTPSAPVRSRPALAGLAPPLPPFASLSRTSSGAMPMDEDEVAATPAYSTHPTAAYSLFAGGGLGAGAALFGQPEAFGAGGSVFRSALETPTAPRAAGGAALFRTPATAFLAPPGSGLAATEATPDIGIASAHLLRAGSGAFNTQLLRASSGGFDAQLLRAGSGSEDALLAAAARFSTYPAAVNCQAALSFHASGPTLPPQQLQSPLVAVGPLALLPLGAASGQAAPSPWASASGPASIWGPPF